MVHGCVMLAFLWKSKAALDKHGFMRRIVAVVLLVLLSFGGTVPSMHAAYAGGSIDNGGPALAAEIAEAAAMDCCDDTAANQAQSPKSCASDCHYILPFSFQSFRATEAARASPPVRAVRAPAHFSLLKPPISG
jgi:hypothetical protein